MSTSRDDESLLKWKASLLGAIASGEHGKKGPPVVEVQCMRIMVAGRPDVVIQLPKPGDSGAAPVRFALKEGCAYRLAFEFVVTNDIVLGLTYHNKVYKAGLEVDSDKEMIGAFAPRPEPYTHEMEEDTAPEGMMVRGEYTAEGKFADDDGQVHLTFKYSFEIKKDW
eukprot:TRINITY_DN13187_c0_g1_i1.p1 TRINITY_DN13187_c0_g1~~TRINITY_DN13187_c0_g1_i1.p1  ORF type:complete len:167 (+),score=13.43 TRINITY_DN13187_c0_g1_i1:66-566(+)